MGDFSCSIADAPAAPHAQAAALAQEGPKPVVAWINHFMYGTQEWYQLSFAAYKTELVEAAGGQNLNYTDVLEIEGVCVCVGACRGERVQGTVPVGSVSLGHLPGVAGPTLNSRKGSWQSNAS